MSANYAALGLCFRQSSDGKLVTFDYAFNTVDVLGVSKFNSPTSWNAAYTSLQWPASSLVFLRIADDGTNRICSVSHDGQLWLQVHSVGRTNFLTADQVGFWCGSNNATYSSQMTLLSWVVA
jgi:hypothetical protein